MVKTVKQLAEECNVSKQTIHRIVRKNGLRTIVDGNRVLIPDDSQNAVYEALEALQRRSDTGQTVRERPQTSADDSHKRPGTSENVLERPADDYLNKYIERLEKDIERLEEQLTVKDEQIRELTAALRAAQVLHGADKQQQQKVIEATETKTAGTAQQDPVQRSAHHPRKTERQQQPSMMQKIIQGLKNRLT